MLHHQLKRRVRYVAALLVLVAAALFSSASPAAAAVPDAVGMVLYDGGAGTVPWGTWPPTTTVLPGAPGQYKVVFPGQAAQGGVVHVTAIDPAPFWCQAQDWYPAGPDEVVLIACYAAVPAGAPVNTRFSATFTSSSGPSPVSGARYGYVHAMPGGTVISQYNSVGAFNTVSPIGLGEWVVDMPGLTTPTDFGGSLQVTAADPGVPARCKVAQWLPNPSGQRFIVHCVDAIGGPYDTGFSLTYQYARTLYGSAGESYGYVWNEPPLGPPPTNYNSAAGLGANTVTGSGSGLSTVFFPMLTLLPDDIQVSAMGPGSEFCGMNMFWAHTAAGTVVGDVRCYSSSGQPLDTGYMVSDNTPY